MQPHAWICLNTHNGNILSPCIVQECILCARWLLAVLEIDFVASIPLCLETLDFFQVKPCRPKRFFFLLFFSFQTIWRILWLHCLHDHYLWQKIVNISTFFLWRQWRSDCFDIKHSDHDIPKYKHATQCIHSQLRASVRSKFMAIVEASPIFR